MAIARAASRFWLATLVVMVLFGGAPGVMGVGVRWVRRMSSMTGALENTCQCDCCYTVGANGRTDCVPPSATSFDVQTCAECDVEACSNMFPITCAQASSIVNSECIVRKGWVLEFIPVFFIGLSIILVAYGLYKKYDGYHDVPPVSTLDPSRQMLNDPIYGYDSIPDPHPPSSMRHVRSPSSDAVTSSSRMLHMSDADLSVDDSVSAPVPSRTNTSSMLDPIPELAPLGEDAVQHKSQSSQTL